MQYLKYFFSLLLAITLMTSCKPDAPGDSGATVDAAPGEATEQGSFATPVLPNANSPKVQLLLRSPYWVAEHWVNHEDNTQNFPNKGRWWALNADGTFTTGQWQETYSNGSWVIYNDGPKELLHFDAANNALDMEFEMQAVSQLQDYMSWSGTRTYDMSRIAVKAVSLLTMPTKQQFNVPE